MATFALHSNLRLKSKQSYTPKGPLDEIYGNGSLLQGEWRENSPSNEINDLKREATGKQNSNSFPSLQVVLMIYLLDLVSLIRFSPFAVDSFLAILTLSFWFPLFNILIDIQVLLVHWSQLAFWFLYGKLFYQYTCIMYLYCQ